MLAVAISSLGKLPDLISLACTAFSIVGISVFTTKAFQNARARTRDLGKKARDLEGCPFD